MKTERKKRRRRNTTMERHGQVGGRWKEEGRRQRVNEWAGRNEEKAGKKRNDERKKGKKGKNKRKSER